MKIRVVTRKVSGSTLPPLPSSKKKQRIPNKIMWTCVILLAVGLGTGRLMGTEEKNKTVSELPPERIVVRHVPEIPEITKTFHAPEPVAQAFEQEPVQPSTTHVSEFMKKDTPQPEESSDRKTSMTFTTDQAGKKPVNPKPEEEEPVEPWQFERLYQPGDRVKYQDNIYVAQRENQGIEPGTESNGEAENPWKRMDP